MKILLIEPYFTGSHKAWAEGYAKFSSHEVQLLTMSGHYWKWRMHGGAITLARKFKEQELDADLILATDMLDLTTFLALTRNQTHAIPTAIYFHENQLAYPWSPTDRDIVHKRDHHYSFINYASAMAADRIFFNSAYNHHSFFDHLPGLLKGFPDHHELNSIETLQEKSEVLPLGMDLGRFNPFAVKRDPDSPPLLLWNHRWEYDKNPKGFFTPLYSLADKGLDFEVVLLGENFSQQPDIFNSAVERLGKRVLHSGFVDDFATYAKWLWQSDIIPVTSQQDFFGGSLIQAMYCNCFPLLPKRLAFPEHIPKQYHDRYFYDSPEDLLARLEHAILHIQEIREESIQPFISHYKWENLVPKYDNRFDMLLAGQH